MINTYELDYMQQDIHFKAFVAQPDRISEKSPAVLIAPDWQGRNQFACDKAVSLAQMGYIAFAMDLYGEARLGKNKEDNRALMTPLREDRVLLLERIHAAYLALISIDAVHPSKVAIIGYCFGGLCALDLARSGADICAAVSFHGLLNGPNIEPEPNIKAKILVLHGYLDPLVPDTQIQDFSHEMTRRHADWQMHIYGQAAHSFTNPKANDNDMGLHYHVLSDQRSWTSCCQFLAEVFSQG